jgi:hypothetical protein
VEGIMAGYSGQMVIRFWTEATDKAQVEQRLNAMLDKWNLATESDIQWDDIDWDIEKETN